MKYLWLFTQEIKQANKIIYYWIIESGATNLDMTRDIHADYITRLQNHFGKYFSWVAIIYYIDMLKLNRAV